jgi:protein-S-isoprenylcysteine O-methyltransferase Ste14
MIRMTQEKLNKHEREAPHSHLFQGLSPIFFIIIMVLDTLFNWSTQLSSYIPLFVKIVLFIVFLGLAILLIQLSHKTIFDKHEQKNEPSNVLITEGILKRVRNPMYLGILLFYMAFICLTLSLISMVFFVIIIIVYNRMVNYEEAILEQLFGEEYKEYKKKVPKWIPKLF